MERGLILLVAALMVYVAPGVHGTAHLSFANNTEVEVNRDGCGVTKLCLETPDDCDPSTEGMCLFVALQTSPPMPPEGTNLSVGLRGTSEGYVAMGLTNNANEGSTMLFICAQNSSNNGSFFFRTMERNNSNGELTPNERITQEIRGTVNNSVIRCQFEVPNLNASQLRTSHATTFAVLLGTGPVENGMIGNFDIMLRSNPLNIANPTATDIATTTEAPMNGTTMPASMTTVTTAAGSALHPHAVLLLLSIIMLFMAQRR